MIILSLLSAIFRGKNVARDLSYGDDQAMVYDEYPGNSKNSPVVIFWHGGSWQTGDKASYRFVGQFFQKLGCSVIVASYPKFPDQTFPGFIKDANQLLDQVKKKYPKSKVFLCGHSSGGHTAIITAMKRREKPVDGVIAVAAPNWFGEKTWPRWQKIFTDPYESKKQETYSYVENSPKSTRYLSIHGSNDVTVRPKGMIKLHEFLMTSNISSKYKLVEGVNHYVVLGVFLPGFWPSIKKDIKNFIDA